MTCLRNTLTREQIKEREEQRTTEAVIRKLLGEPEPTMPPFKGQTTAALADHRIGEIKMKTDVGYPWSEGPWYAKHHTCNAVDRLKNNNDNWDFLFGVDPGGMLPKPEKQVCSLRDRIDPAIYVVKAELDDGQALSDEYDRMEARALGRITAALANYKANRKTRQLKEATAAELTDAMQELYVDLVSWQKRMTDGLDQLTPREMPIVRVMASGRICSSD